MADNFGLGLAPTAPIYVEILYVSAIASTQALAGQMVIPVSGPNRNWPSDSNSMCGCALQSKASLNLERHGSCDADEAHCLGKLSASAGSTSAAGHCLSETEELRQDFPSNPEYVGHACGAYQV